MISEVLAGGSYPVGCKSFRGSHGDPRAVPPDVFCLACRSLWPEESSHCLLLIIVHFVEEHSTAPGDNTDDAIDTSNN